MVKIRLSRIGAKGQPYYRVVVVDERKKRDGRFLEIIGTYNPRTEPSSFEIDKERLAYWRSVGAQATEPVLVLLGEGKPKRHQEKNKQVGAVPATPAPSPAAQSTPTEGAAEIAADAPETTPEPSIELAKTLDASQDASPETTSEVVQETIESKETKTEQAALQNEPTTQDETASSAEVAEEVASDSESVKPSEQASPEPTA